MFGLFRRFLDWLSGWRDKPAAADSRGPLWRQLREIEALTFRVLLFVFVFILIYSFAQPPTTFSRDGFKILGVLVGAAVASIALGGFLGFLFGIPRLLQHPSALQPAETSSTSSTTSTMVDGKSPASAKAVTRRFFASNTNLEEISDWLTKIIVGISLVQANKIITGLQKAAEIFKSSALPDAVGADVVFVLILISATVIGFMFFYMETRTRITILFADAELLAEPQAAISEQKILDAVLSAPIATGKTAAAPPSTDGVTTQPPAPISEDKRILTVPYESLKTAQELAAWASAQARANNTSAAIRALQDAIAKEPDNRDLLLRLADIQERRGNARAVYDVLTEAGQKGAADPDIMKRELAASLYLSPPESFQKAIPIAEELKAYPDAVSDPLVWLWAACAYGQRYRWLLENNGDDAQKADARQKALDAIRRVVALAPDPRSSTRVLLRQVFDPERENSEPYENDLEALKTDQEFRRIIYPNG